MKTLELGSTSLSTSPSHSRCACALSWSEVISIFEVVGTISGREKSVCGSNGTTPNASTFGAISEPPAERKYAVEPVGVEIQIPSAGTCAACSSFKHNPNGTIRETPPLRITASLSAKYDLPAYSA